MGEWAYSITIDGVLHYEHLIICNGYQEAELIARERFSDLGEVKVKMLRTPDRKPIELILLTSTSLRSLCIAPADVSGTVRCTKIAEQGSDRCDLHQSYSGPAFGTPEYEAFMADESPLSFDDPPKPRRRKRNAS